MKKIKNCKHCHEPFQARRSNHVYCSASCKTKASYKRNEYKYVSGHYKKPEIDNEEKGQLMLPDNISSQLQLLEDRIATLQENLKSTISGAEIGNAAIGSASADAAIYGLKKLFNPSSLNATKGDIEKLKEEMQQLKKICSISRVNKLSNNF